MFFMVFFLEDWRSVFDINFYGCDKNLFGDIDGGVYYVLMIDVDILNGLIVVCLYL